MKKLLLAAAALGTLFTGCVDNEPEVGPSAGVDKKISFAAPLVSGTTRVEQGEIANPYPTGENFAVYALRTTGSYTNWSDGTAFMTNVECAYDSTLQGWDPAAVTDGQSYYWPKSGKLTFYAYSPAQYKDGDDSSTVVWQPVVAYTDNADKMTCSDVTLNGGNIDLLYSELAKDKTAVDNNNNNNGTGPDGSKVEYNGVELKFRHALSSIKFKVKLNQEYTDATITVKSIKLNNIYSKGSFSWAANETSFVDPEWTPATGSTKGYAAVANEFTQTVTVDVAELTSAKPLLLLPQTFADQTIEVSYNVKLANDIGEGSNETATVKLSDLSYTKQGETSASADEAKWKPGRRYIYTITFGLDKIYFDPVVENFVDVEATPVGGGR